MGHYPVEVTRISRGDGIIHNNLHLKLWKKDVDINGLMRERGIKARKFLGDHRGSTRGWRDSMTTAGGGGKI